MILAGRRLAAEQHLIAHNESLDDVWITAGKPERRLDFPLVLSPIAPDPDPLHDLQAKASSEARDLALGSGRRIGADAGGHFRQLGKIGSNLCVGNVEWFREGAPIAMEWRVGEAAELLPRCQRRGGQGDGAPYDLPEEGDDGHHECKEEGQADRVEVWLGSGMRHKLFVRRVISIALACAIAK